MSKGKIFLGTVFGAAAGFIAGILSAPKSGKETREDLKRSADHAKDVAVDEFEKVKDATLRKAGEVKEKTQEVAGDVAEKAEAIAKDVTAKAKDVASDAKDKGVDLKARVEQAVEGAQKGFAKKPQTDKNKK